jgi:hypothetical protein
MIGYVSRPMDAAMSPPSRVRKPAENRDKRIAVAHEPGLARRMDRERLETLLDGLERA